MSTLQHPMYSATQNNLFKHISEPVPDNPGGVSTAALHIQQKATKKKKKGEQMGGLSSAWYHRIGALASGNISICVAH